MVFDSLWPHGLYSPWNSPGQDTGVGSLFFLQGIFPTQESNPGLPHCRRILYQLSHKGRPRILEWVAYLFSRGSFWPRNQTRVSCIAGRFFTNWTIREAQNICSDKQSFSRPQAAKETLTHFGLDQSITGACSESNTGAPGTSTILVTHCCCNMSTQRMA